MMDGKGKTCGCGHHKVVPIVVTLIGLAFLLQTFDVLSANTVSIAWPILLIIGGLTKLGGDSCNCC